jgi:hypothetical protein
LSSTRRGCHAAPTSPAEAITAEATGCPGVVRSRNSLSWTPENPAFPCR